MNDDLPEMLHRSVDDHPLATPDLLPRAQAARRRRRGAAVGVAAAVVAVGVFGASQLLPNRTPVAVPAAGPAATEVAEAPVEAPAPDAVVPHDVIVERCLPQVPLYRESIRFASLPDSGYRVAFPDREYEVGDPVLLEAGGTNMFTCLLPEDGAPVPDPLVALNPSLADPNLLAGLCSEMQYGRSTDIEERPEFAFEGPDLRGAEVVLGDEVDGMVNAILKKDGEYYGCVAMPQYFDLGGTGVVALGGPGAWERDLDPQHWSPLQMSVTSGEVGKSVVPGDKAYQFCGYLALPGVRSIEFNGQVNGTVDVDENGLFACIQSADSTEGVGVSTWKAYDGEGNVVSSGVTPSSLG